MKITCEWPKDYSPAFVIAAFNFLLFAAISLISGGEALNGKVLDGKYFLMSTTKQLVETTKAHYYFSLIHGISVFALVPLALIFGKGRKWHRSA